MICNICQKETKKIFDSTIIGKFNAEHFQCESCGAIQTNSSEWLEEAYKNPITDQDTGLVYRNLECAKLTEYIIKRSSFNIHKNYLDYAGGYGLLVRLLRDKGFNFFLYDSYCQNLFAENYDITDFETDKNHYELITAFEVFEHLTDPLKEIEKIFKHTDSLFFSTKLLPYNGTYDKDWDYFGFDHGQHVFFYSLKTLQYLAKKFNKNLYSDGRNYHLITSKKFLINPFWLYKNRPSAIFFRVLNKIKNIIKRIFSISKK